MAAIEPSITPKPAVTYVGARAELARDQLAAVVPRSLEQVGGFLRQHRIQPSGPALVRYRVVNYNNDHVEIDVGFPVDGAAVIPSDERVHLDTIPPGDYAVVTHAGSYDTLVKTTAALLEWAKRTHTRWRMTEDGTITRWDARVEYYNVGPTDDPDPATWRTEIAILLAR